VVILKMVFERRVTSSGLSLTVATAPLITKGPLATPIIIIVIVTILTARRVRQAGRGGILDREAEVA
jgi:hypothetical protein